jgi:hypothetical protein
MKAKRTSKGGRDIDGYGVADHCHDATSDTRKLVIGGKPSNERGLAHA